jgi:MFS family permease
MAFFRNDAVNRINLHYGVEFLAIGMGGVFYLAFLLHAGVPVPVALATQAGVFAARFALRPLILPLGKRWGLKPMVIIGVLLMAAQYPLLAQVHGLNVWLFAFNVGQALGDIFYWPSYHAYFASLGDDEHRGHQVSAREAAAAVVGIVSPLIGAWTLVTLGPVWTFGIVAAIQAASALPLLGIPNVLVPASAPEAVRRGRGAIWLFISDGWFCAGFAIAWQAALFGVLGSSLANFGGAVALSALVGAGVGLVLGRFVDLGHGRRAVLVAYTVTAGVVLLRVFSFHSRWLALAANALGALSGALVTPAIGAVAYNQANRSSDTFRFHLVSEGGWDIGFVAGCLLAAGIAAAGLSLAWAVLVSLLGSLLQGALLWRYFGRHPEAHVAPVALDAPHLVELEAP